MRPMSYEEYLAWEETQETRHDYIDGYLQNMEWVSGFYCNR